MPVIPFWRLKFISLWHLLRKLFNVNALPFSKKKECHHNLMDLIHRLEIFEKNGVSNLKNELDLSGRSGGGRGGADLNHCMSQVRFSDGF